MAADLSSAPADASPGHWEHVYATRAPDAVGWFQTEPTVSLRLVETYGPDRSAAIVDVGGGAARLVDGLLADGYTDLTVLDVAANALDQVRARVHGDVTLVQADVTTWSPGRQFVVWHDRAVFHFLGDADARARYAQRATAAIAPRGALVLGTFAPDGPTHCSGLPVCRCGPSELAAMFVPGFALVHEEREIHVTPAGVEQPYTWVVLRRV